MMHNVYYTRQKHGQKQTDLMLASLMLGKFASSTLYTKSGYSLRLRRAGH